MEVLIVTKLFDKANVSLNLCLGRMEIPMYHYTQGMLLPCSLREIGCEVGCSVLSVRRDPGFWEMLSISYVTNSI